MITDATELVMNLAFYMQVIMFHFPPLLHASEVKLVVFQ